MAVTQNTVRRLPVAGEDIEFADQGEGEPVLLIHGGVFSDWFLPLTHASQLARYRLIRIRRAGSLDGTAPAAPLSFDDHVRHCAWLLDALDLKDAHVCGHSSGALVALQLALDAPTAVRTLTVLEPASAGDLAEPTDGEAIGRLVGPAIAAAAAGDVDTAFDTFLGAVGGPGGRALVERTLGRDGLQLAVGLARTPDERGAGCDRLAVHVRRSSADHAAAASRAGWAHLPGVTHLMPLQDPAGVAGLLADFIAEHPSPDVDTTKMDT